METIVITRHRAPRCAQLRALRLRLLVQRCYIVALRWLDRLLGMG